MPWIQDYTAPLTSTESIVIDYGVSNLEVASGTFSFLLRSFDSPPPSRKRVEISAQEVEGSLQVDSNYQNRALTIVIRLPALNTRESWYTALGELQELCGRANKEGLVIARTSIGGAIGYYDVLDLEAYFPWDLRYAKNSDVDITLKGIAKPFIRGDEIGCVTRTNPFKGWDEPSIRGDVDALARLLVTNTLAVDINHIYWGAESEYVPLTDVHGQSLLYYEAETRFLQNGSFVSAGVVRSASLGLASKTILSTQDSTDTYELQHIGTFRVLARVRNRLASVGVCSLSFAWTTNDWDYTTGNAEKEVPAIGDFVVIDLGMIRIDSYYEGQRWQGVFQARSTVAGTDYLDIDSFTFIPTAECSGECGSDGSGVNPVIAPLGTMEIHSDRVLRTSQYGGLVPISVIGDYLKVPPAGSNGRMTRLIVRSTIGTGDQSVDTYVSQADCKLYYTPRYLVHPHD